MSTSERAMMLCGWGVKAGMARLQVYRNCVLPYLSALENAIVFKGALRTFMFTLLYTPSRTVHSYCLQQRTADLNCARVRFRDKICFEQSREEYALPENACLSNYSVVV